MLELVDCMLFHVRLVGPTSKSKTSSLDQLRRGPLWWVPGCECGWFPHYFAMIQILDLVRVGNYECNVSTSCDIH